MGAGIIGGTEIWGGVLGAGDEGIGSAGGGFGELVSSSTGGGVGEADPAAGAEVICEGWVTDAASALD